MADGPYKLPEGWRWVRLGEVCEIWDNLRRPVKKKLRNPGEIPYCGANGVIDYVSGYTHEGEFVLLAEDGGFYGPGERTAYLMRGRFWANNHVHIVRGKPDLLTNTFLLYWLIATDLHPYLTGATRPKLTQSAMRNLPIPLPPLDEQRRIVAKVEALMARVREARRLRAEARKDAERLMRAALSEVFPRPGEALPAGWRWVRLGEVCLPTERRDPTKNPSTYFLYVYISAIDNTVGKIVSPKEILGQHAPSRARKVIRAGDVIFATTRPYLKNIALVPPDLDGQICSTGFCVIRPNREFTEPKFLFFLYRSDFLTDQLTASKMRGASYPAVTDNDVYNSLSPLPALEEQRRIVAYLDQVQQQVAVLKHVQAETEAELKRLEQAILDKAFRGEL